MTGKKYLSLRKSVINTCLEMNNCGINQGTSGNVSIRVDDGFLITASGVPYGEMRPEHVVHVTLDGGYFGESLPSSEWRMHLDIYRERQEAQTVVHVHSIYAAALSCLRQDIPAFHYMIAVAGGNSLRCADYATFGTEQLSVNMLKALEGRCACLLANHGQICFGRNFQQTLAVASEIEVLCQQYAIAVQSGKPVILDDEEMKIVCAKFKTYGPGKSLADGDELNAVLPPVRLD